MRAVAAHCAGVEVLGRQLQGHRLGGVIVEAAAAVQGVCVAGVGGPRREPKVRQEVACTPRLPAFGSGVLGCKLLVALPQRLLLAICILHCCLLLLMPMTMPVPRTFLYAGTYCMLLPMTELLHQLRSYVSR